MSNKMLIDASHPEETRVVVMRGDRVEEFDFESALRKQLRGNIYLAKVTRVEPSLQAAFVDYGGNRHGFLAFNEIHPDYYQLPQADRQALLDYEREEARESARREAAAEQAGSDDDDDHDDTDDEDENKKTHQKASDEDDDDNDDEGGEVESVGSEDALEELPERQHLRRKHYKIQEVIKRRQIILVQVVKEERGNKGAALTTYLSLAGRYTVLMPNTARGGGISRKIASATDRKRLRKIVDELEVPEGMGLIVRTAGASRTKAELKRDFEYLLRLWENVRDLTLQSSAPTLVYEEGNLIKRSIRDLYDKEIEEVLVAGEEEYREAKDFMRMLMPSHAKNVQPFKDSEPLFTRYKIEAQLNAMYSPYVTLPSGGYIVINQTEALVSVDVNSGRSTKEHSIEDTALKTNLEAAAEVSRQLRLRDLAGLVVIDFIDMEERRNNRAVERRLKDCLRHDRARIQVGRISHFGLLEMSRQRLRTGVLEGSTSQCPHCQGTGMIRSTESMALTILRALEDRLQTQRHPLDLICNTNVDVALYILNNKRSYVHDIERRYGVNIGVEASAELQGVSYTIENKRRDESDQSSNGTVVQMDWAHKSIDSETTPQDDSDDAGKPRRRRRRGGQNARRNRDDQNNESSGNDNNANQQSERADNDGSDEESKPRRPRRRGRRGGRRRNNRGDRGEQSQNADNTNNQDSNNDNRDQSDESRSGQKQAANENNRNSGDDQQNDDQQNSSDDQGNRRRRSARGRNKDHSGNDNADNGNASNTDKAAKGSNGSQDSAGKPDKSESIDPGSVVAASQKSAAEKNSDDSNEDGSPRRGWWQKRG